MALPRRGVYFVECKANFKKEIGKITGWMSIRPLFF